jgi:hypothetical protein
VDDFGTLLFAALFNPIRFAVVFLGCLASKQWWHLGLVVVGSVVLLAASESNPTAWTFLALLASILASAVYVAALFPIVLRVRRQRALAAGNDAAGGLAASKRDRAGLGPPGE